MRKDVLLVEPDSEIRERLEDVLVEFADVTSVADFAAARACLRDSAPPDLLLANLRLQSYNGIHLALLADPMTTKCVVYADEHDRMLAREVQSANAFYERLTQLPYTLRCYVQLPLPDHDMRDPDLPDRRRFCRGGRRASDIAALAASVSVS